MTVLVGQNLDVDLRDVADRGRSANRSPSSASRRVDTRTRRGGDERHHAADREPAAGRPQLPQLRRAGARHPAVDRSAAQDDRRRRPAGRADQRLHRRRELQERRAAGRRRSARTPAAATRSRRTPCRSSASSRRTTARSTTRRRAPSSPPSPSRAATSSTARPSGFYQPKQWVSATPKNFQFSTLTTNDDYSRSQPGISLGGPIIKDKLHFFLSYEGDDEQATTPVTVGNSELRQPVRPVHRHLPQPVQVEPGVRQAELAAGAEPDSSTSAATTAASTRRATSAARPPSSRPPTSRTGSTARRCATSGTATAPSTRRRSAARTTAGTRRRSIPTSSGSTSRASSASAATARPRSSTSGASSCATTTTSPSSRWRGDHSFQVGGNVDFLRYNVNKSLNGNPVYNFRNDPANGLTFAQPFEAQFGFGNPQPLGQQQGVRHLRPGHLDRQSAPDAEPRPALGL